MLTLDNLTEEIKTKRQDEGRSWRSIAKDYGINGSMARMIYIGYKPGKKIRQALGLSPSATIIIIGDGNIPEGAQAICAAQCSCGQWFIPNSPIRTHCFVCRPFQKQKKERSTTP